METEQSGYGYGAICGHGLDETHDKWGTGWMWGVYAKSLVGCGWYEEGDIGGLKKV